VTKVLLSRSQLGCGGPGFDVTAKSATGWAKDLAPPWDLVRRYRACAIDDAAYTEIYLRQLSELPEVIWDVVYETGLMQPKQRLVFQCYCPNSAPFCHTHILVGYLVKHDAQRFSDARPAFMQPSIKSADRRF